jgi:uncharacterized membrane protein
VKTGLLFVLLLCLTSLVALTGVRQVMLQPLPTFAVNIVWLVLQIAPILLVLPGVLRFKRTPMFLASLAGTLYFIHGVMLASTEPLRLFGLVEAVIAIAAIGLAAYMVKLCPAADGSVNGNVDQPADP